MAMFAYDSPDKGSGSRSGNHKAGQANVLRKKQPKAKAGITESGQPADRALLKPPAKTPNFPVATGPPATAVKAGKTGKPSSLRSR